MVRKDSLAEQNQVKHICQAPPYLSGTKFQEVQRIRTLEPNNNNTSQDKIGKSTQSDCQEVGPMTT